MYMRQGALSCGLHISEDRSIVHEQSGCPAWLTRIYLMHDDCFGTCETIGVRNAYTITKEFLL